MHGTEGKVYSMSELKENVIEWYTGDKMISVTLSQKRYINRVKKLVEKHADMGCELVENRDGSIWAKIPLRALHLTIFGANNRTSFVDTEEEPEHTMEEFMYGQDMGNPEDGSL